MNFLPSVKNLHNSKLYFSNNELRKILACYSLGVSKGNWKDYAILFGKQEASFCMYKHSMASPDCILTKSKKSKKNAFLYNLKFSNINNLKFSKIDDIIVMLKRKVFKIH